MTVLCCDRKGSEQELCVDSAKTCCGFLYVFTLFSTKKKNSELAISGILCFEHGSARTVTLTHFLIPEVQTNLSVSDSLQ